MRICPYVILLVIAVAIGIPKAQRGSSLQKTWILWNGSCILDLFYCKIIKKALENLSTSALRNLLIEDIKKFIIQLDHGSTEELTIMKLQLRKIYDLISEKERQEAQPLIWGKSATQIMGTIPQTDVVNVIPSNNKP